MEGQELKYCTYAKFPGIRGLLFGWFLVGLAETPHFGGYSADFAQQGCTLLLIELDAPLPPVFRFMPRKAKEIARFKNGEVKWMSRSTSPMK